MTKNKLLELYEKFQLERLNTLYINHLKNFSDYKIDLILKSKYTDITIRLMINKNFQMLHEELQIKLINIVNSAKNKIIAEYTALLIEDTNIQSSGLLEKLAEIISKSQESYQASNALTVAKNKNVLVSGVLAPHLVKIVSETIGAQKCFNAMQVATNIDVLRNSPSIVLTELISKANTDCKSDLAASVAKNKILLESTKALEYTLKIINAKTDSEARLIYSDARKEIKNIEQQRQKMNKLNEENIELSAFWQIYTENPEEAISLLKENIKDNEEITIHTRVRRKK